jgi:nitroreductase
MELSKIFEERYSVRSYLDTPVEDSKIDALLEAMRIAPTGHNDQPQRVYVLKSEEAIAKIRACTKCAFNAPLVMMVCAEIDAAWRNRYSGRSAAETDAAIVTTYMMLKAQDMGLTSCWVHHYDPQKLKAAFNLPEGVEPLNLLTLGYAAEDAAPLPMHFERKSIEELATIL